jgi:hypothetical protein
LARRINPPFSGEAAFYLIDNGGATAIDIFSLAQKLAHADR